MFGCVFAESVHGYVWCDRHGWALADETCVCGDCVQEAMEAQIVDEFSWGEFDDGAHWRRPAQALSPLSPTQWASEPCADPEWTDEALDAAVTYMDEVEARAWLVAERAAEWATQRFVSQWTAVLPVWSEARVQKAIYDMAKGKNVSRIFR